jgi:hypothetical protein
MRVKAAWNKNIKNCIFVFFIWALKVNGLENHNMRFLAKKIIIIIILGLTTR